MPQDHLLLCKSPLLLATVLATLGCDASLGGTAPGGALRQGSGDGETAGTIGEDDLPSASTRFRRLTHNEWSQTSIDLLDVSTNQALSDAIREAAADFRADPRQGGYLFDGQGETLEVDSPLWSAYQRVAAELAQIATQDGAIVDAYAPEDGDDEARAKAFIRELGRRAHRRPLSEEQEDAYFELFGSGLAAYPEMMGFRGGLRLVIEGLLQSPHFIYRAELSDAVVDGMVPLDGYERASRLSYLFWGTMPDDELFKAAADGELDSPEGARAQAIRLISDPRAKNTVVHYFEKLLNVEHYEGISPDESLYSNGSDRLREAARRETVEFIQGQIYEESGSLRHLFTSRTSYVNEDLAAIYDLPGDFGAEFVETELDPETRSGILTQIGFLASNATTRQSDPIHRGVFLAKRLSCLRIAAPPDDIPPLPTPGDQSNRQLVAEHTEAEGSSCRNCHLKVINPFGFAFEHFDAVGAYREKDGDHPVNASAEILLEGGKDSAMVSGARELSLQFAESPGVHECLTGHLIAFAQGRNTAPEDEALIEQLALLSIENDASFRDLMVEVAIADSFLNRPVEAK